jgi:hypothetical protein
MAQRFATIYVARVRARRLPGPRRMRRRDWVCREQFRRLQVTKTRPEFEHQILRLTCEQRVALTKKTTAVANLALRPDVNEARAALRIALSASVCNGLK